MALYLSTITHQDIESGAVASGIIVGPRPLEAIVLDLINTDKELFSTWNILYHFFQIIGLLIHFLYIHSYFNSKFLSETLKKSEFYHISIYFSSILSLRLFLSLIIFQVLVIKKELENGTFTKISMKILQYLDFSGDFFCVIMVFLMALNRCLTLVSTDFYPVFFKKSRILILVPLTLIFAVITAVILINTSEMQRVYIRSIGFVDSGVPGYQMLINRIFYIFPFGSIICYIILYFHIRQMTQQVISRAAQSGEQRVFIQLFITILFYGAMCAVFEYINTRNWLSVPAEKINLVAVLNIVNYLPEISLPLMLLISNTILRRRISTIVGPRVTKSVTVVPMK